MKPLYYELRHRSWLYYSVIGRLSTTAMFKWGYMGEMLLNAEVSDVTMFPVMVQAELEDS